METVKDACKACGREHECASDYCSIRCKVGLAEPVQATEACPTCGSPDPKRHPAVQHEGEVQVCQDVFHHSKWPCFFCCSPRAHYVVISGLSTIPACIDCERRRPAGADEVAEVLSRPGPRPETALLAAHSELEDAVRDYVFWSAPEDAGKWTQRDPYEHAEAGMRVKRACDRLSVLRHKTVDEKGEGSK